MTLTTFWIIIYLIGMFVTFTMIGILRANNFVHGDGEVKFYLSDIKRVIFWPLTYISNMYSAFMIWWNKDLI